MPIVRGGRAAKRCGRRDPARETAAAPKQMTRTGTTPMTTMTASIGAGWRNMTSEEKFVIFASSLGTVFEWYDFYLYAVLAPFFAALFFPSGNDTAALLSAFATYAAGFLVRPFGALIFGRIGDLVGRKYTFLVTIMVMGTRPSCVGLLPTFASGRLAGADPAGEPAPAAGPGARRRIRRRRDLRRRACAPETSAASRRAGSRPPRRSACSGALIVIALRASSWTAARLLPSGAGAFRSWSRSSCSSSRSRSG